MKSVIVVAWISVLATASPVWSYEEISMTDGGAVTGKVTITWIATDPNEDELVYSLWFRTSVRSPWILLKDKLKDPTFDWDTRNVGDGRSLRREAK